MRGLFGRSLFLAFMHFVNRPIFKCSNFNYSPPTHVDNKGFRPFEKGLLALVFLKPLNSMSLTNLKIEDGQMDPMGSALALNFEG